MTVPSQLLLEEHADQIIAPLENTDGRTMRRTRNRAAVVTALLELIREGDLEPSAVAIAERAGVSHRSIFRYFDDLDDLVRTCIDQAISESKPYGHLEDPGEGTFDERVSRFVDTHIRLFAHLDRPMQVARMRAYSIPSIDEAIARVSEFARCQIRHHFAPELATYDEAKRDDIVDAVLVLTSYDAYSIHIRHFARSTDQIRTSWTTALTAVLGACSNS